MSSAVQLSGLWRSLRASSHSRSQPGGSGSLSTSGPRWMRGSWACSKPQNAFSASSASRSSFSTASPSCARGPSSSGFRRDASGLDGPVWHGRGRRRERAESGWRDGVAHGAKPPHRKSRYNHSLAERGRSARITNRVAAFALGCVAPRALEPQQCQADIMFYRA